MSVHIENRRRIVQALREELVGPSPQGKAIDCNVPITFATKVESYGPWRQMSNGDEILQRDPPFQRYGAGVLSPLRTRTDTELRDLEQLPGSLTDDDEANDQQSELLSDATLQRLNRVADRVNGTAPDDETDDLILSTANAHKPSSMAVSFLADCPDGAVLSVEAHGGRYREMKVRVEGSERDWWLRSPVTLSAQFAAEAVREVNDGSVRSSVRAAENDARLKIQIEVFSRPYDGTRRLVTACLVNRTDDKSLGTNETQLFQAGFTARVTSGDGEPLILPYPEPPADKLDDEEQSLALLYRASQTFAVGHGCAADWDVISNGSRATAVRAECLPVVEVPSITPDIRRDDGSLLVVPMRSLAGLVPEDDGLAAVEEVVERYERWIAERRAEIDALDARHRAAALRHMEACERSVVCMRAGLEYLNQNARAKLAFQLANHAMLLQQTRSRREPREARYDAQARRFTFAEDYPPLYPVTTRGAWRPFQIAFLLATIQSAVEGEAPDRETVELIWFPTGGGKTEAYLGLAAFAIFMRRLIDPTDVGVHVLMRYTLRLLTAQQFQRAAGLICAMEYLRAGSAAELGNDEISIGIWLGGATTPNTRSQAVANLKDLRRGDRYAENKFVLNRCPWCAAQIGPVELDQGISRTVPRVLGYTQRDNTVAFTCSDSRCDFRDGLPIYVIDDDVYEQRPSLVIGTVDKFAMLAWRPEARALFGLDNDGERCCSPPGLIIQDELHLISGPLGSMVGLYEAVIEDLCTDHRGPTSIRPKIVSSTATIRRYQQQIKALYARDDVVLFPPPGLDASDSFFASYARLENDSPAPGRMYLGVHAPGLGSLQTVQARVFASLLQAPVPLPPEERDPWWTLMIFFNSLRELGTALSLFQSRVPDYLWALRSRHGLDTDQLRKPDRIEELTSRLRSDEVPAAITDLEIACTSASGRPIDACLSSSIIEVGIDIDRLSLMSVVGQPKTTSQYIQVTGRVGRSWWERPGLIVTLLSPTRPRDRSHFEKFRTYHERLYAQVEPTSVTPFSPPALDRALHAAMVCYARQSGDERLANSPQPFPQERIERLREILIDRVSGVDREEYDSLVKVFDQRAAEWRRWDRSQWQKGSGDADIGQLYVAGSYVSAQDSLVAWATPMSMRTVDAECQGEITRLYLNDEMDGDE